MGAANQRLDEVGQPVASRAHAGQTVGDLVGPQTPLWW
jgi:hypothetical protein